MKTTLFLSLLLSGLALAGAEANLLKNGTFQMKPSKVPQGLPDGCIAANPPGWGSWNAAGSKGQIFVAQKSNIGFDDDFAVMVKGMKSGCLLQSIPVKPETDYEIKALCRKTGKGETTLTIAWQNEKGVWSFQKENKVIPFVKEKKGDWKEAAITVKSPKGAAYMAVMGGVKNQDADSICYFDNFEAKAK